MLKSPILERKFVLPPTQASKLFQNVVSQKNFYVPTSIFPHLTD